MCRYAIDASKDAEELGLGKPEKRSEGMERQIQLVILENSGLGSVYWMVRYQLDSGKVWSSLESQKRKGII